RDPETLLLFLLAVGGAIALAAVGVVRFLRARSSLEARFDLALGLACVLLLPQLLQRAEDWHIRSAGVLGIALAPHVAFVTTTPPTGAASPGMAARARRWALPLSALAICAFTSVASLRDDLRAVLRRPGAPVFVERAGRRFPLGDSTQ